MKIVHEIYSNMDVSASNLSKTSIVEELIICNDEEEIIITGDYDLILKNLKKAISCLEALKRSQKTEVSSNG